MEPDEHAADQSFDAPHRRERSRLRSYLTARVSTVHGTWPAILHDISLTGAGIELREMEMHGVKPPSVGSDIVLEWAAGDAFGSIVWMSGANIGMAFDEIVPPKILIATRDIHDDLVSRGGFAHLVRENARRFVQGRRAW